MGGAARAARFARTHSGELPVAEYLPRLLSSDSPPTAQEGTGVARGIQAGRGHPEAVSVAAVLHAAHRRAFQENPEAATRRGAGRRHSLRGRFHAASAGYQKLRAAERGDGAHQPGAKRTHTATLRNEPQPV